MVGKETPEQREYYKPFRCAAGYILALTAIMNALQMSSAGITIAAAFVFQSELLQEIFSSGVLYGCIILGYYLCYMIFFRKYVDRLFTLEKMSVKDIPGCLLVCLGTFAYMLACWEVWALIGGVYAGDDPGSLSVVDIFYACLGAPVMEEIVFRHWMRKVLKPYGRWCYVLFSALFFGLFHGTYSQSVPAFFIGLAFGLIAWRYQSIIPTVLLHIANNTLSTVASYYPIDISDTLIFGVTTVFLAVLLILKFRKMDWKQWNRPFKMIPHSVSCMVFIVVFVALIVLERLFGF